MVRLGSFLVLFIAGGFFLGYFLGVLCVCVCVCRGGGGCGFFLLGIFFVECFFVGYFGGSGWGVVLFFVVVVVVVLFGGGFFGFALGFF